MIEFLEDYTTKSLPPEHFERGQRVDNRTPESELYFVRLGVAGLVHDGVLVDQDYKPITVRTVVEVVSTDRRFASAGRGGEVLGLDAPQRASTGPGNAAVFGSTDLFGSADPELHRVQVEQLSTDLAASVAQLDEHRITTAAQIDQLTADLTTAQGAREAALADVATANTEKAALVTERDGAVSDLAELKAQHAALEAEHQAATARIADLEQQIAASGTDDQSGQGEAATKPVKAGK
jgi:outer membrane murein-binding lipoprotein Lpp